MLTQTPQGTYMLTNVIHTPVLTIFNLLFVKSHIKLCIFFDFFEKRIEKYFIFMKCAIENFAQF